LGAGAKHSVGAEKLLTAGAGSLSASQAKRLADYLLEQEDK